MANRAKGTLSRAEVAGLFSLAVSAMEREDKSLTKARSMAATWPSSPRSEYAHGLAYWVFETTLVYAVFKAWSEAGKDVEWEWSYGRRGDYDRQRLDRAVEPSAQKADLVLFSEDTPVAVFEFKWWPNETAKVRKAISDDLDKLRSWNGPQRFLIAMWFSPREDRDKDKKAVEVALKQRGPDRDPTLEGPISYFDTLVAHARTWDFATALIRV